MKISKVELLGVLRQPTQFIIPNYCRILRRRQRLCDDIIRIGIGDRIGLRFVGREAPA